MSNGLSDLDLVAQAMAPTEPPKAQQTSTQPKSEAETTKTQPTTTAKGLDPETQAALDSLDIDISTLSADDLAAIQPILNALKISGSELDGEEDVEGDAEGDEFKFQEILKQLDAADDVADELEGKLDALLASLGTAEKEIVEQVEEGKKGEEGDVKGETKKEA